MTSIKPRMERIQSPEYCIPRTDDGRLRCQAMELSRLYFLLKWFYQCTGEATDIIRTWDSDDRGVTQLPVCLYHKEHWLKHFGGEFNEEGEIERNNGVRKNGK